MTEVGGTFDAAIARLPAPSSMESGLRDFAAKTGQPGGKKSSPEDVREAFTQFVGQTFFGQMLKAMRSTVGKPAYFHGGRAEEVFQGQLDQTLAEHMTNASAEQFADPMFRLQFPQLADETAAAQPVTNVDLTQLAGLPRR